MRFGFGCGSDGCGSNVARRFLGPLSDLVQTAWQKLRESGFEHNDTEKLGGRFGYF